MPEPQQAPEPESVEINLPDGSKVTQGLPPVEVNYQVQMRCVVNGQIVSPSTALAILLAERDFWRKKAGEEHERAEGMGTQLADAKAELQHLRPE